MRSMQLDQRRVLVFGGSSGIGLGIARAALEQGASVVVAGRTRARLERAATEAGSERFRGVVCDVGEEDQIAELFRAEAPFHHVVVTAVEGYYRPIRELDVTRARRTLETKLVAALSIAKHARFEKGGSLTLTAGIAALRPGPGAAVIAAANGGIEALVRALALELRPVRVNALAPGWIDTPFWDDFAGDQKLARFDAHAQRLPVGRVGTPADIARGALFLMGSGFVTGEVLRIDGGHPLV